MIIIFSFHSLLELSPFKIVIFKPRFFGERIEGKMNSKGYEKQQQQQSRGYSCCRLGRFSKYRAVQIILDAFFKITYILQQSIL